MSEGKQIHGAGFLARGARGLLALADAAAFFAVVFDLVLALVLPGLATSFIALAATSFTAAAAMF